MSINTVARSVEGHQILIATLVGRDALRVELRLITAECNLEKEQLRRYKCELFRALTSPTRETRRSRFARLSPAVRLLPRTPPCTLALVPLYIGSFLPLNRIYTRPSGRRNFEGYSNRFGSAFQTKKFGMLLGMVGLATR